MPVQNVVLMISNRQAQLQVAAIHLTLNQDEWHRELEYDRACDFSSHQKIYSFPLEEIMDFVLLSIIQMNSHSQNQRV